MLKPCEKWNPRLSAYLDGEGNTRERKEVEEHLAACPACRAAAEVLRCDEQDVMAALHTRAASDAFAGRVMAQVAVTPMEGTETVTATPSEPQTLRRPSPKLFNILLQWGIVTAAIVVIGSIIFPIFPKVREKSYQNQCMNHARQLAIGLLSYAQDNDETLPAATNWVKATGLTGDPKVFLCPTFDKQGISYEYNTALSNVPLGELDNPAIVPLIWCKNNHSGGMIIAFVDGHVAYHRVRNIREFVAQQRQELAKQAALSGQSEATIPEIPAPGGRVTIIPPDRNYGLADKLMIAYTAIMALQSADVQNSMERAESLFREYDGFVLDSEYTRVSDDSATATVSGRVPSIRLGQLLVELDGLGRLQSRTVNGEDLTAEQIAQVEKLGNLAETQQNLTTIEKRAKPNEALKAEESRAGASTEAGSTRIEQYKLKSRVTLAEVTVQFSSLPKPQPKTDPVKRSASKSFTALKAFGTWLFTGILIPLGIWLPVWGPLLALGIVLRRRYLRR